jgi:hypothetical protein
MRIVPRIVLVNVLLALLLASAEVFAVPTITQSFNGISDGQTHWTRTPDGTNTWKITLEDDTGSPGQSTRTIFTITRGSPTETVIISELKIVRPGLVSRSIIVRLGGPGDTERLESVSQIVVEEGTTPPPNPIDRQGYVWVDNSFLDGELGVVTGLNRITLNTNTGNVVGPVTCKMHPDGDPAEPSESNPFESEIILSSLQGSLTGNVKMEPYVGLPNRRGVIRLLDFPNGHIGRDTINDPIVPVQILADGIVAELYAREIHAQIMGTNTNPNVRDLDSFMYNMGRIETNRGTVGNPASGMFTGEIRAELLGKDFSQFPQTDIIDVDIFVTGDMLGRMWFQTIRMGKQVSMAGLNASGVSDGPDLIGGIFVSARDPGGAPATVWGGRVEVGPDFTGGQIVLTGTAAANGYSNLASELGTGVAGYAPFKTHFTDSFPKFPSPTANPSIAPLSAPSETNPIKVRHYGPVKLPTGGLRAFKVESRPIGGSTWTDISTCFTESLDSNTTIVNLHPVRILPGGFEYRVTQEKTGGVNRLLCDLPSGGPPQTEPVANFTREFQFTVCDSISMGDAESDGVVNFADVTSVLSNFGLTDCLRMGDADRDGDRDFADITEVLANFNVPYCQNSTQSVAGKGDGFATMGLEPEMSAASAAMAIGDALFSMGYASIEEFTEAIALMATEERDAEIRRLGVLLGQAE